MKTQTLKQLLLYMVPAVVLFTACAGGENENAPLHEQVSQLIEEDRYEDALTLLSGEDQNDPRVEDLLERTHLNYGLHNMNTFSETEMRTRMNDALRQFTEVLRINPDNEIARSHIDQILQVYATIPDTEPEQDVIEGLREVGIQS